MGLGITTRIERRISSQDQEKRPRANAIANAPGNRSSGRRRRDAPNANRTNGPRAQHEKGKTLILRVYIGDLKLRCIDLFTYAKHSFAEEGRLRRIVQKRTSLVWHGPRSSGSQ